MRMAPEYISKFLSCEDVGPSIFQSTGTISLFEVVILNLSLQKFHL